MGDRKKKQKKKQKKHDLYIYAEITIVYYRSAGYSNLYSVILR